MPAKVLVLGATGRVGREVLTRLSSNSQLEVLGAVRSQAKALPLRECGIETVVLDLDSLDTYQPALAGVQRVLLLTGYTVDMLVQSKAFIDAAEAAGVEQIVHIGASGAATNAVRHWAWHQLIEAYIQARFAVWTHIRPEAYMQNILGFGWLQGHALISYIGQARWSWVDCVDVARLTTAILEDPGSHSRRIYRMGYEAATMEDVARSLQRELGYQVRVSERSPDEFYQLAVSSGIESTYAACVREQFRLNAGGLIPGESEVFEVPAPLEAKGVISWSEHIRLHASEYDLAIRPSDA